jgi:hypothetical protein
MWLSLSIGAMVLFAAVSTVAQLPPMLIPVVCAGAALTAAALFVVGSVFFVGTIETTANLRDNVDQWPELSVMDWILQSFYVVNSLTFSLLPLVLLVKLLPAYPAAAYGSGLALAFLFFPVVLLSMLEETTCMMPYCSAVWRSLGHSGWAWLLFHLHSIVLLVVLGLVGWAGFIRPNPWTTWLFVTVAMVLSTIYFRLLGRLAYVIGRESDTPAENEDET